MNIKLETKRLILREVQASDVDGLFELDNSPNVQKYVGNKPVKDKFEVEKTIENLQQQYAENGIARWAVIDKNTNEFMGWSGIKLITGSMNNHNNFYELGFRFIERYWGKGFATETTFALADYAFENLNTEDLYAICDVENKGSKNVLEKTGLKFIETFNYEGKEHNWFQMTRSDWRKKRQNATLETERLLLKPVTPKIVSELFEANSVTEIKDYFQFDEDTYLGLKSMYKKGMETYRISLHYFLLMEKSSNQVIGECGFHTWNISHNRAEVFYSLRKDAFKNKGYMTEALNEVLKFGFNVLNLHRVQALVANDNMASLKLLAKFKFKKEGTARQDYLVNGFHEDSDCYSLLKHEL